MEDNAQQAREMALEGLRKLRQGSESEGRELIEEAKRLDHDAIADLAPEDDVNRFEPDNAVPRPPQSKTSIWTAGKD